MQPWERESSANNAETGLHVKRRIGQFALGMSIATIIYGLVLYNCVTTINFSKENK